jgi:membrane protease YdiL (CAAX protease family)
MRRGRRNAVLLSAILLLPAGHAAALLFREYTSLPWVYSSLFYGAWLLVSCLAFLRRSDLSTLFSRPVRSYWYALPLLCAVPLFVFIFFPNRGLLRADGWLAAQIALCLTGPVLEEVYWRGLASVAWKGKPLVSFAMASLLFGASHPLIFGVNSRGDSGWIAFAGTAFIGAVWWLCLQRTKSLRGCIATHLVIDVAGMAVYVLANKALLVPI